MGVKIDKSINALIDNYDKDFKKMISNYLRMRRNLNILSSEAVLRLNDNYKKSGCGNRIFIIMQNYIFFPQNKAERNVFVLSGSKFGEYTQVLALFVG